jgi:Ca2+-binding RTX toxin-like protein
MTCIRILAAAAALTLSLAVADSASARGTITYDGTTMTFTGDAAADHVGVGPSQGELAWTTSGLDAIPPQCSAAAYVDYLAYCPWPQRIVVQLGGGNDTFSVGGTAWDPFPGDVVVASFGGDGDDRLQSGNTQDGGPGNDTLEGHDGTQVLHGGPGDDNVNGLLGSDHVYGDDGNDIVSGDGHKELASPDVIDGGPGTDKIDSDWQGDGGLAVTLGGGADDGRPGEGDEVRNVEQMLAFSGGRYVGTAGADRIEVVQVAEPSDLTGGGGNDFLKTSDGADRLDGGAGADTLDGGFGDDTLVGGPGPDSIAGDHPSGECGIYWCKLASGNDTIVARDGEKDSVMCSVGADTVYADPIDVVAPDCETIDRGAAPPPDPNLDPASGCLVPKLRGLTVRKAKAKLQKAGCKAKVRRAWSRRARRGRVIKQSTRAGKRVKRGATVTLTISRGRR